MKAVVLAAGKGTRMRTVSLGVAKILLPLADGSIGDNLLRGLKEAGVSEVLVVVGHMERQVKEHFGDGSSLGLRIHYVRQEEQLGTGHATALARDFAGGEASFLLAYGDVATPGENCGGLVSDFLRYSPEASLSVCRVNDPYQGAAVHVENGYLRSLVEKPRKGLSASQFDNAGIYMFTPRVFEMLDKVGVSPRGEYELTDALTLLVENGYEVRAYELSGFWSNVSSPEDLLEVNRLAIDRLRGSPRGGLRGSPAGEQVSPLACVHRGAILEKCSIGPYSVVAEGARVKEAASVSRAIICRNAVVGEEAVLERVLVGPGCVVAGGTRHVGSEDRVVIFPDEG